jgi:hypothetical protein
MALSNSKRPAEAAKETRDTTLQNGESIKAVCRETPRASDEKDPRVTVSGRRFAITKKRNP